MSDDLPSVPDTFATFAHVQRDAVNVTHKAAQLTTLVRLCVLFELIYSTSL